MNALARRAVACKGWRWMPGMCGVVNASGGRTDRIMDESEARLANTDLLPDLEDPATLGCLLALGREAWGDATLFASTIDSESGPRWMVASDTGVFGVTWSTEAEALVAALEAAP